MRSELHKLLEKNPNFFGTADEPSLTPQVVIQSDTSFEELTCVGYWPEKRLLEATIVIKRSNGYNGGPCTPGSREFVRFYIDWNGDGDYVDAREDAGVTSVNVHDLRQADKHPIVFAVRQGIETPRVKCNEPRIVKVRAILSWEQVPTGPGFVPIWGNVTERWIQIQPTEEVGVVTGPIVAGPAITAQPVAADALAIPAEAIAVARPAVPKERRDLLQLLKKNPNHFGTLEKSDLAPVLPKKYDVEYEELECIGLFTDRDFLEAVVTIKKPYGYAGDPCSKGSKEYLRFYIDWNGNGDYTDFTDDAGVISFDVHDFKEVNKVRLSYAVGRTIKALRANCQAPYVVKVRGILSWNTPPTGPSFVPVWGNVLEAWVQVQPTDSVPKQLVAKIDQPAKGVCADPALVPSCLTAGVPLAGIRITGDAGGAPFDRYRLRYSWSGGTPIETAVVYPNCSRPPAVHDTHVPVIGGTLGYLDVTLLPAGVTEFTIFLDVFDAASGSASATSTFQLRTSSIEISAVATVGAYVSADPFNTTTTAKLVKDTATAPFERSVGGAFSVTGSAYVLGCDRVMSQYVVARSSKLTATSPVPSFPDAGGMSPIITPVIYDGTSAHPWQSGCFPSITSNVILNGNLVSFWGTLTCTSIFGFTYSVPKIVPVPNWSSGSQNGRFVLLVEVQDVPVGGGAATVAGVDQVAVWIDNQSPTAKIESIGGLAACGDLYLSHYKGTPATIVGIAWDPPIDITAPQIKPNDNFGSYSLRFQKNGGGGGPIPAATPATRVPNTWSAMAPATGGTLANWNIVAALDGGTTPAAGQLARGERCAYVITLDVADTTHVGDSGNNHTAQHVYAINIINDL